jgi:MFS family permease
VAIAGFLPMFFFLTLYMQTVLGYSPIQTGVAYLPLTGGFIIASISSQLFARIGTKPVVVLGMVIAAAGLYWLSQVSIDSTYVSDILPGLLTVSIGMGGVFTGLTTAANAGVDQSKAGLAAGLLNTGQQLGAALGLAILSAVATAQTKSVLRADGLAQAATHGYQRALLVGALIVLAATVVALLTPNNRQTTPVVDDEPAPEPALDLAA